MAYQQQQDPLWDFIRSFDPNTGGAANTNDNNGPPEFLRGFPFFNHPAYAGNQHPAGHHPAGPHPHRGHGPHGRGRRHNGPPPHPWAGGPAAWGEWPGAAPWFQPPQSQQQQQTAQPSREAPQQPQQQAQQEKPTQEKEAEAEPKAPASPDTMTVDSDVPDPAVVTPDESDNEAPNATNDSNTPHARGQRCHARRHRGRRAQPETAAFPFDLSSLLSNLSSHPIIQNIQTQAAAANTSSSSSSSSDFTPPLDLFSTPSAYVLHLSLPGVQKSDVGVDWDPERSVLRVAGVVHRPGNEEFQATLVRGERRVGAFAREVVLPPGGDQGKEEVDADGITAKMEDGVLVVTVPKVEKEWTEIRKVDIE